MNRAIGQDYQKHIGGEKISSGTERGRDSTALGEKSYKERWTNFQPIFNFVLLSKMMQRSEVEELQALLNDTAFFDRLFNLASKLAKGWR